MCQQQARRRASRHERRSHIADQTGAERQGGELGITVVTGQELARYGEQQAEGRIRITEHHAAAADGLRIVKAGVGTVNVLET